MTKNQENRLSMYLTVQKVTNYHSDAWKEFKGFKSLFNEFESILATIRDISCVQEKKITGVTREKTDARDKVIEKALIISDAVYIYASLVGDYKTADRVSYRLRDFKRGRDTIIIDRFRIIHEAALKYLDHLSDYGVSPELTEEFSELIEKYVLVSEGPRQAITNKSRATKQLKDYFLKADMIIKKRLDKLINQFKADNPDFWLQYKNARKIIDYGHRRKVSKNNDEQVPLILAPVV